VLIDGLLLLSVRDIIVISLCVTATPER
jgi:hypothetical protein